MSQRKDIHKVLIIGSGPIIIGQACEFDYSGTQACKALRKLGYEIVLVNSNPATIMTDPEMADVTYIEPLNVKRLEAIIDKERPDALLPNLGGQSGLNLCSELAEAGVLDKYNVKVIGVQVDAIERGEDRIEFKNTMNSLGIEVARSEVAYSVDEALSIADKLGYPVVLRPAYTMGGAGGGLVYNKEELQTVCARGLKASLVGQVLVEECVSGWEELELEVVRDKDGNMITVCFIENIDPMGVHTGDSFCSAPMLTISQEVQDRLQKQAYAIVDAIQVIGGTNVQFAHDPVTDRIVVIEINPRTSRSSALASKATGFPIALVSAMLASGLTLSEIPCGKYGTLDKYVPDGDYVVIKFARWAFEKFKGVEDKLGTQMRAVGEVMSIGKNLVEAGAKEGHERIGVLVGGITRPEAADIFNHVAEGNQLMTAEIGLPFRVFFIIADMAPCAGCLGQPVACQGKADLIGINGKLAAQRLFTARGIAQGRGQGNQRLGCKQCFCPGQFRLDSTCIFHDMPEIKIQVIREDQIGEKLRDGDKRSLRFRCGMRDGGQCSSLAKG